MNRLFAITSAIFSPLLVPCYGLFLALSTTGLSIIPLQTRLIITGICSLIMCVLPGLAILGLYRLGRVSSPGLNQQNERTIPYCIAMICYLMCVIYLFRLGSPLWLLGVGIGGIFAILISIIINLRWKISGHMASMGGLIAISMFIALNGLAVIDMFSIIIIAIMLTGLVSSARLGRNRHTPLQLLAGLINGFSTVYICSTLLSLI